MLIDAEGNKQGLVSYNQALESARDSSLDLVQVSPSGADPIVCKLLDYGKYLFDKKKIRLHQKLKLKEILQKKLNLDLQLM